MARKKSKVATETPTRRSTRPRTPIKRLDPSQSLSSTPSGNAFKIQKPVKKKSKSVKTKPVSDSTDNVVDRLELWKDISRKGSNIAKLTSRLFSTYEGNRMSIISLGMNTVVRAAGFKTNTVGLVQDNEVLNIGELLEEQCEEDLETTENDLASHLFSTKSKNTIAQQNFIKFWKHYGELSSLLFQKKNLTKTLGNAFECLLGFGIASIRHCAVVAFSKLINELLILIKISRKEILSLSLDATELTSTLFQSDSGFVTEAQWSQLESSLDDEEVIADVKQLSRMENFARTGIFKLISLRSKDVNQYIRSQTMSLLLEVAKEHPSLFEEDVYLKYVGWGLYDKFSKVRKASISIFIVLYSLDKARGSIIVRYKARLLEMLSDIDISVSVEVLKLLNLCDQETEFTSEEIYFIDSLLFHTFSDNYLQSEKALTNKRLFIKYTQGLLQLILSRCYDTSLKVTTKQIQKLVAMFLRVIVFQLGSSELKERQNYFKLIYSDKIDCQEFGKKLQLLSLPISYHFVQFFVLNLLLSLNSADQHGNILSILNIDHWISFSNDTSVLNKQEQLCLLMVFRSMVEFSLNESLSYVQPVLFGSNMTEFDFSITRKNKERLLSVFQKLKITIASQVGPLLTQHSDDNLLLYQLVKISKLCFKGDLIEKMDLLSITNSLVSIVSHHSDENLVFESMQFLQQLSITSGDAQIEYCKKHFLPKCIDSAKSAISVVREAANLFESEIKFNDFNEEVEISLSVNMFKVLAFSQAFPEVILNEDFSSYKSFASGILEEENRTALSSLPDNENDKKQTLISCRGLFIKYYSKFSLLVLLRELPRITEPEYNVNALREDVEALLHFLLSILDMEDSGALMEAEMKDTTFPVLSELYSTFSLGFLAKLFEADSFGEDALLRIRTLVLDVEQQSERSILNLVQLRVKELAEDVDELEANVAPEGDGLQSQSLSLHKELRLSLGKDLRVAFTVQTLIIPVLRKLLTADYFNELNVKTAAFMLQYFHNQPDFIEQSIGGLINLLFENSLHYAYIGDICFMSIKYVFSLYERNRNESNEAELTTNVISFIEKLAESVFKVEKGMNNLVEGEDNSSLPICQIFVKCADFALIDFPQNKSFLKFFKYLLIPIRSYMNARKKLENKTAVHVLESFRKLWVQMVSNLSHEIQNTLYGDANREDINDFIEFEKLLGVKISIPGVSRVVRKALSASKSMEVETPLTPPDAPLEAASRSSSQPNEEGSDIQKNIFSDSEEESANIDEVKGPLRRRHDNKTNNEKISLFDDNDQSDSESIQDANRSESEEKTEDIEITGFVRQTRRPGRRKF